MKLATGYQLIEPSFARPMPMQASGLYATCSMLCWIADTLTTQGDLTAMRVTLEVIVANYSGPYPCLALAYVEKDAVDVSAHVEQLCLAFVEEAHFNSYLRYLADQKPRIDALYEELLTHAEGYPRGVT
jgi:hypothetical protein